MTTTSTTTPVSFCARRVLSRHVSGKSCCNCLTDHYQNAYLVFFGAAFPFRLTVNSLFVLQGTTPQTRSHSVSLSSLQNLCGSVFGSCPWGQRGPSLIQTSCVCRSFIQTRHRPDLLLIGSETYSVFISKQHLNHGREIAMTTVIVASSSGRGPSLCGVPAEAAGERVLHRGWTSG